MKAVYYESFGGPDVLRFGDRPVPQIEPDEVLVQVAAAAVNPIDRRLRNGELQGFFACEFPIIPGWDCAGRIVEVGAGVDGWALGDDIAGLAFTWVLHGGTYAEYAAVKAESIAHKPARFSFIEAASLPLCSLTAWQSLVESSNVRPGHSVLVQAGAGGLGSIAISMAKYLGAKVYTTCRESNFEYVRERGAEVPIDYTTSDYVRVVREHEPDGVDMVLETLSGDAVVEAAIRLAKPGGSVIYMNNEPPEMPEISARNITTEWLHHRADGAMLQTLLKLYDDGDLALPRIQVMPLDEAVAAHQKSESGHTQGKVVLHVQDL